MDINQSTHNMTDHQLEQYLQKLKEEKKQKRVQIRFYDYFISSHKVGDDQKMVEYEQSVQQKELIQKSSKVKVALKLCYDGREYGGLAMQENNRNTVEQYLNEAMRRSMLVCNLVENKYSRSGRTDKGVSAAGQVVALYLRHNPNQPIDYIKAINAHLPTNIRILQSQTVDQHFNARHHCKTRVYKYFFMKNLMDINLIKQAIPLLIGNHDFRNYCKVDLTQCINYVRTIYSFDIHQIDINKDIQDDRLHFYQLTIIGNGFLWHQIRCMVQILFLIGNHLEDISIIPYLLDIQKCKSKPHFDYASEFPLLLYDCRYDLKDLQFDLDKNNTVMNINVFQQNIQQNMIEGLINSQFMNHIAHNNIKNDFHNECVKYQAKYQQPVDHQKLEKRNKTQAIDEIIANLTGKKKEMYDKCVIKKLKKEQDYKQI